MSYYSCSTKFYCHISEAKIKPVKYLQDYLPNNSYIFYSISSSGIACDCRTVLNLYHRVKIWMDFFVKASQKEPFTEYHFANYESSHVSPTPC